VPSVRWLHMAARSDCHFLPLEQPTPTTRTLFRPRLRLFWRRPLDQPSPPSNRRQTRVPSLPHQLFQRFYIARLDDFWPENLCPPMPFFVNKSAGTSKRSPDTSVLRRHVWSPTEQELSLMSRNIWTEPPTAGPCVMVIFRRQPSISQSASSFPLA